MLNNDEGLKIAVIVNDVAEINIDNKLIAGNTAASLSSSDDGSINRNKSPAGIVQLSNGCACCSIADELLPSVSQLVTLSDMNRHTSSYDDDRGEKGGFDHIVIELSGVASPKAVRANFQEAEYYGMPLLDRVQLDTMVTVVDCSTFLQYLQRDEGRRVNKDESPELFFRDEEERILKESENDNLENYWSTLEADTPETATISQLIAEQTETSDVILLNKLDTISDDTIEKVQNVVSTLNSKAQIFKTRFGVVERLSDVLGAAKGLGVTEKGIGDDHRELIDALEGQIQAKEFITNLSHEHSHEHSHDHNHHHDYSHVEIEEQSNERQQVHSLDQSHDNRDDHHQPEESHTHGHSHEHKHNHEHSSKESNICTDPNCKDASHSHEHTHSHDHSHSNTNHGQVGTYIYRARKPFHPSRLTTVLRMMPVIRGLPPTSPSQEDHNAKSSNDNNIISEMINHDEHLSKQKVFKSVIRSKGFAWLAHSHIAAMYWSHAGSSFEMQCLGRWWATLERYHWPEEAIDDILRDFDDVNHVDDDDKFITALESSSTLSSSSSSVGDRRQEIVFIGQGLDDLKRQHTLKESLDACLLSDEEFQEYKQLCTDEDELSSNFGNEIDVQMMTF